MTNHNKKIERVAIVLPDLRAGGAERVSLHLAAVLSRRNYDVEFVLMRLEGEFIEEAKVNYSVYDLRAPKVRNLPWSLAKYIRKRRPAALLVSMWPLTALAPYAKMLSRRRCSLVIVEHGLLSSQYRDWGILHRCALRASTLLGYRLCNGRVGVSSGVVKDMAALSWMRESDFVVIGNPVPQFSPPSLQSIEEANELWGVPHGGRILTVGSLKPVKNHALLLESFSSIADPKKRLLLVGDGGEMEKLQKLAIRLNIQDKVIFAGFRDNLAMFYDTADLFVLSSDREGLPTVLIEALNAGVAIVSTRCPSGPDEILDGGKFGLLVPTGDKDALAEAIVEALSSQHHRPTLKSRGAKFNPDHAADQYLRLMFSQK